MSTAIRFQNVSKQYNKTAGQGSFRDAISNRLQRFMARNGSVNGNQHNTFFAVNDVSFEVQKGEVFGIVGHNGAGKTTILKLLSQVTRPTSGDIQINGRLSALIELGAGFHPDLTGRENVYLNGSILGLSHKEIDERYDRIVDFAGLKEFMNVPVKRYSSGMYARLGFSVAAHVNPDVLLVDEVLAVGDVNFQRKCIDHMKQVRESGATVVFISHNMVATQGICDRVMWLEQGICQQIGPSKEVIGSYLDSMAKVMARQGRHYVPGSKRWGSGEVIITNVRILDDNGQSTEEILAGSDFAVEVSYHAKNNIPRPNFGIAIMTDDDIRVVTAATNMNNCSPENICGEGEFRCKFIAVPLVPGNYSIVASIYDDEDTIAYDRWGNAAMFAVTGNPKNFNGRRLTRKSGIIYANTEWTN